ncbi:hypothetical protein B0F88_101364 [Methylobacter tundripaludum]|uniref:DGQHR domain-containing protein n=1 Tax=Methylobacter tundripaludum TaxID=173365 RepID=A0A2S6H8L7_9GAMM|nr:hypothetical protein [Methylobacter tundripaludum]PPK73832.1 hypothetical protein B0F88_101364 [Methylobacter tundripaludum]
MSLKHDADGFLVGAPIGPITLRGVLADTLGGFLVVRGYAKFSELAARSIADPGYQRDLIPKHQTEIETFYRRGEYLFFPEVVLSLELQTDYEKPGAPDADPVQLVLKGETFKSNINGVSVKVTRTKTATGLARANITLPEEAGKILKRIDGNHRISAFEAMTDVQRLNSKPVSFCIVLLTQGQAEQIEKALFYNINSKAKPLTSEQIYRSIIEDEAGFPDDVLERDFGTEFVVCRQTRKELNFTYLSNLLDVFGQHEGQDDNRCSVLIESLKNLQVERKRLNGVSLLPNKDDLLQAILKLNNSYVDERLQCSTSLGLFSAFLFFAIQDGARYRQFETWMLKNHLYELQAINASDVIRIFEKVAKSRKQQIFVSMWFDEKTKSNFEAIKAAVDDLNQIYTQDIKLRPIRIDQFDTGFSYQITAEILRLIDDSGYLIADLTGGNKNVYHEIGFLMGLNQGRELPHENFLLLHNDGIGEVAKDVGFNLNNFKQIRVSDTNSLREQLKKHIAIYYELEFGA